MNLPPDRFCNMVYVWLAMRQESEDDLMKMDHMLSAPLPWEEKKALEPENWNTGDDDGFMAAMQALGKRG